jgi:peptidyl-tRNA hydrolase, PTH2 family
MFEWLKKEKSAPIPVRRGVETVQYLVVRQDLEMSPGKMSAQSAHAACAISLAHRGMPRHIQQAQHLPDHQGAFLDWCESSFAKVVLRAKGPGPLKKICQQLEEEGVPYAPIFDACRTELTPEEDGGGVFTCIGVTPLYRDEIPKCLKQAQLFH